MNNLGLVLLFVSGAYALMTTQWPYPVELFLQERSLWEADALRSLVLKCGSGRDLSSTGAQWVRIAYHDMSTHGAKEPGMGGLDASIRFETDRSQNIGLGMLNSLRDFYPFQTPYSSLSDTMAFALIAAYQHCGGPTSIPFRHGRVDATEADVEGVPEPQQDIETHTAIFARQGFSPTEMIGLVACGHTLGGVRKVDFPTAQLTQDFALFQGQQLYGHKIVTDYVDGTTVNPLVTTTNETLRSDLRVFSSDQNVTVQGFVDNAQSFDDTCTKLLARMIDTVPAGVQLSDVVEPIVNKIGKTRLFVSSTNATLNLTTSLRVLSTGFNTARVVNILWNDRTPGVCPTTGCKMLASDQQKILNFADGDEAFPVIGLAFTDLNATIYNFDVSINPAASISKFWFEIQEEAGGEVTVVNNADGNGYPVEQDVMLWDPIRSINNSTRSGFITATTIVVGIKENNIVSTLTANAWRVVDADADPLQPLVRTALPLTLERTRPPVAGYSFYSARVEEGGDIPDGYDIQGVFGETVLSEKFIETRPDIQIVTVSSS